MINMPSFKSYWTTSKKLFAHKYFESQLLYTKNSWLTLILSWSRKNHHAGLSLRIGLFGFEFHMKIYDSRHWDFANDCYVKPNDKPVSSDLT